MKNLKFHGIQPNLSSSSDTLTLASNIPAKNLLDIDNWRNTLIEKFILAKKIEENGVRYEFGACLYIAYVFGFIEIVLGIVHFIINPFKTKSNLSDSQSERLDALGQSYQPVPMVINPYQNDANMTQKRMPEYY